MRFYGANIAIFIRYTNIVTFFMHNNIFGKKITIIWYYKKFFITFAPK